MLSSCTRRIQQRVSVIVAELAFVFFSISILVSGCANVPPTQESLAGENKAVIKAEDPAVRISLVDGKSATDWLLFPKLSGQVELTPGKHVITILYLRAGLGTFSKYIVTIVAETGHLYLIKDGTTRRSLWSIFKNELLLNTLPDLSRLWIFDATAQKTTEEILGSTVNP